MLVLACLALARQDFYKLLGVERSANAFEVKKAYRKQAIAWHPDKVAPDLKEEAQARFIEIQEAYETLSDPAKRRRYDNRGDFFDGPSPYGDFKPPGESVSSAKDLDNILGGEDAWLVHVYFDEVHLFGDWMYRLQNTIRLGHVHIHKVDEALLQRLQPKGSPALFLALEGQLLDLGQVHPYFVESQILAQLPYDDTVAEVHSPQELEQFLSLEAGPGLRFLAVLDKADDRHLAVFLAARKAMGSFAQVGRGLKTLLNVKHVPSLVVYDPLTKRQKVVYMPSKPKDWVMEQQKQFGVPELSEPSVQQRCPKCKKNLLVLTFAAEPDANAALRFGELCQATTKVACFYLRAQGTDWAKFAPDGIAYVLASPDLTRAASVSRSALASKQELKQWMTSAELEETDVAWPKPKAPPEPLFKLPKEVLALKKQIMRYTSDENFPHACLVAVLLIASVLMPMLSPSANAAKIEEKAETEVKKWTVRITKPAGGSFGLALGESKDADPFIKIALLRDGSPAGQLGEQSLQAGDRLVAVDGVTGSLAMRTALQGKMEAEFTVERDVPKQPALAPGQALVGIVKEDGKPLGMSLLPTSSSRDAVLQVQSLKPGGVAATAGVQQGDRIVAVNGKTGAGTMQRLLVECSQVQLTLQRERCEDTRREQEKEVEKVEVPPELKRFCLPEQRWKQWTVTVTKPAGGSWGLQLGETKPEDSYLLISGVKPGSVCGPPEPNLKAGDRILAVDGVRDAMGMRERLVKEQHCRLTVERALPHASPPRAGLGPKADKDQDSTSASSKDQSGDSQSASSKDQAGDSQSASSKDQDSASASSKEQAAPDASPGADAELAALLAELDAPAPAPKVPKERGPAPQDLAPAPVEPEPTEPRLPAAPAPAPAAPEPAPAPEPVAVPAAAAKPVAAKPAAAKPAVVPKPAALAAVPKPAAKPAVLARVPQPAAAKLAPLPAAQPCVAKLAAVPAASPAAAREALLGPPRESAAGDDALQGLYATRSMLKEELGRMQAVGGQLSETQQALKKTTDEYNSYALTLNSASAALQGLKQKCDNDRRYVLASFAFFCSTCTYIALKRLKLLALGGWVGGWAGTLVTTLIELSAAMGLA